MIGKIQSVLPAFRRAKMNDDWKDDCVPSAAAATERGHGSSPESESGGQDPQHELHRYTTIMAEPPSSPRASDLRRKLDCEGKAHLPEDLSFEMLRVVEEMQTPYQEEDPEEGGVQEKARDCTEGAKKNLKERVDTFMGILDGCNDGASSIVTPLPSKRGKLRAYFRVMTFLFLLNPVVFYASWGSSTCHKGAGSVTYIIPFAAALLTGSQMAIQHSISQETTGRLDVFPMGPLNEKASTYLDWAQSMAFKMTHKGVATKSVSVLQMLGVLELLDWFADAIQPGQVHQCALKDPDIDFRYASTFDSSIMKFVVSKLTLSGIFVIACVFSYATQAFYVLYLLYQIDSNLYDKELALTYEKNTSTETYDPEHPVDFSKDLSRVQSRLPATGSEQQGGGVNLEARRTAGFCCGLCGTGGGELTKQVGELVENGKAKAAKVKEMAEEALEEANPQAKPEDQGEDPAADNFVKTAYELASTYAMAAELSETLGLTVLAEHHRHVSWAVKALPRAANRSEKDVVKSVKSRLMSPMMIHVLSYFIRVVLEADIALYLAVAYIALFYDDMGWLAIVKTVFTITLSMMVILHKSHSLWGRLMRGEKSPLAKPLGFFIVLLSAGLMLEVSIKLGGVFVCPSHFFNVANMHPHCAVIDTLVDHASNAIVFDSLPNVTANSSNASVLFS